MINAKKMFLILLTFINFMSLEGSFIEQRELKKNIRRTREHIVTIPGQNGAGGGDMSLFFDDFRIVHTVPTPSYFYADLGQNNCLTMLKETMDNVVPKEARGVIIHASSQGTATALNYAAQYPERISALILEAVLPSGNSTIVHTVESTLLTGVQKIPGSNWWLPYLAKVSMPFYSLSGLQPILNVENIPNIPIIIIHSRLDPQTPFTGAQALYAGLRKFGRDETYLITIEEIGHVCLLHKEKHPDIIHAVQSILWHNNIFFDKKFPGLPKKDLEKYQPDLEECNIHYENLVTQENAFRKSIFSIGSSQLSSL
ncbi:MAG: alpha/beta hydrolase [Janthinobacterium lividum]